MPLNSRACHSTVTLSHARSTGFACFHRTICAVTLQNTIDARDISVLGIAVGITVRAIWRRWNRRGRGLEAILRTLTVTRGRAGGRARGTDVGNHTSCVQLHGAGQGAALTAPPGTAGGGARGPTS